jgi:hypothetical protein
VSSTWAFHVRDEQRPPKGDWTTWIYLGGRGAGKTRAGAEWVRARVEEGCRRIAIVGANANDARYVMVEGESGLLSVTSPWLRAKYEPSKRLITWPNGAIATLFSAEEPDMLRGPQHDTAWCDELAKWTHLEAAWDNYEQIGSINGPSRMGFLSANLPTYSGANPDNTNTLTVDLSESAGVLSSGSLSDAQAGRTLCYVDGELISYVTATLIDATATNESHAVPQVAPFEVAVKYTNTFLTNISVSDGLITFTEVSSNPGTHQYAIIAPGVYEFNGPYAGAILFSYTYGNPSHYQLTGLERGMYGTTISAHPANAEFARLDVAIFEFDLPNQYVGIPLYIKLPSVNIFGLGAQTLADVSAFDYTPIGTGIPGGIVKTGTYTATSADATAGTITIATGLAVVSVFQVTITRGTVTVTGDAKVMSSGANIIIANGPSTYTIAAGDVINWLATGATQLPALLDTSGNIVKDTSGNTIFTL